MEETVQASPLVDAGCYFKPKPIIRRKSCVSSENNSVAQAEPASSFHPVISRVLHNRGVSNFQLTDYAIAQLLPPAKLKGLRESCEILYKVFEEHRRGQKHKIVVVGDFDVDGATSVVVALRGLRAMGFCVDFFIPDRFELGYGLSPAVVEAAASLEPTVLMTVDNGIASIDGVVAAKQRGWTVIITDHHLAGEHLPDADAIVNPNQPGCEFSSKNLAGVGVMFYVLIGLRAYFREKGVDQRYLPNLAQLLDIVALGTVADVVPLCENNRRLVSLGLARMRSGYACLGLQALAQVSGRELLEVSETDLGFSFGPRINAAGRLDDMSVGVQCLLSETWEVALRCAQTLDELNRQRRGIQQKMQEQADIAVAGDFDLIGAQALPTAMIVYQPQWHQGIVGLLASRLKDRWYRPVIALARVSDTELKGSGRSIPGVHLRDALDRVAKRSPQILSKFGGHAMAAGLSLEVQHLEEFQQVFQQVMDELITPDLLAQTLVTDGELAVEDMSLALATDIERTGPWGQAFPEPSFDGIFEVLSFRWLKEKHLKFVLKPCTQAAHSSVDTSVEALFFNVSFGLYHPDEAKARALLESLDRVKCVYRLQVNRFRGASRLQLLLEYIEPQSV